MTLTDSDPFLGRPFLHCEFCGVRFEPGAQATQRFCCRPQEPCLPCPHLRGQPGEISGGQASLLCQAESEDLVTEQQMLDQEDLLLRLKQLGSLRAEQKAARAALFAASAELRKAQVVQRQASGAVESLASRIEDLVRNVTAYAESVPAAAVPPQPDTGPGFGFCYGCGQKCHTRDLLHWCEACQLGNPDAAPSGTCRVCGCTSQDCTGCVERSEDGEPCHWVNTLENLCSACIGKTRALRCRPNWRRSPDGRNGGGKSSEVPVPPPTCGGRYDWTTSP